MLTRLTLTMMFVINAPAVPVLGVTATVNAPAAPMLGVTATVNTPAAPMLGVTATVNTPAAPMLGVTATVNTPATFVSDVREDGLSSVLNRVIIFIYIIIALQLINIFINLFRYIRDYREKQKDFKSNDISSLAEGLVACVTRSKCSSCDNEDSGTALSARNFRAIAVADGVGMASNASAASRDIIKLFTDFIPEIIESLQPLNEITRFYREAQRSMRRFKSASATFMAVIECQNYCIFTQLADGSAYLLTQSLDDFKFTAISILLTTAHPHTPPQIGTTGMYHEPKNMLYLKPKNEGFIWIIASDGMNDLRRNIDGIGEVSGTKAACLIAEEIWHSYKQNPRNFTDETVKGILWKWLKRCQTDDDATLAVLIDSNMLTHWKRLGGLSKELDR